MLAAETQMNEWVIIFSKWVISEGQTTVVVLGTALILRTLVITTTMTAAHTRATDTVRVAATMAAVWWGRPDWLVDDDWTCGFDTPPVTARRERDKVNMNELILCSTIVIVMLQIKV